jgi:hypothetical protein
MLRSWRLSSTKVVVWVPHSFASFRYVANARVPVPLDKPELGERGEHRDSAPIAP